MHLLSLQYFLNSYNAAKDAAHNNTMQVMNNTINQNNTSAVTMAHQPPRSFTFADDDHQGEASEAENIATASGTSGRSP